MSTPPDAGNAHLQSDCEDAVENNMHHDPEEAEEAAVAAVLTPGEAELVTPPVPSSSSPPPPPTAEALQQADLTDALNGTILSEGDDIDAEVATARERYNKEHELSDDSEMTPRRGSPTSNPSPLCGQQEADTPTPISDSQIMSLSTQSIATLATPSGIEESLSRMFESEHFSVRMCVMYIAHYQKESAVLLYLVQKLQTYPLAHVEEYIPQLVCMLLHSPNEVGNILEKHLFLTACARCMHFALKTIWHIESDTSPQNKHRRVVLREKVEAAAINRKNRTLVPNLGASQGSPMAASTTQVEAEVLAKDRLCEYYNSEMIFIAHLTSLSNELRKLPREEREGRLSNELNLMSARLEAMHVNLPLSTAEGAFRRIVRVPAIPGRSRVLNSRERAPYLVLFEYIEGGAPHQPGEVGSPQSPSTSPIPNTLTSSINLDVSIYEGYFTNTTQQQPVSAYGNSPSNNQAHVTEEEALVSARLDKVFGNSWGHTVEIARSLSPYGKKEGWGLIPVIVKAGDDMRQEVLAMQLITTFDRIWKEAELPVRLNPYGVVVTSCDSGIIELVTDAASIDGIKKKMDDDQRSLVDFWHYAYGEPDSAAFRTAQRNFVESMAGYSAVSYILQLKDRHNANILLRRDGSVVHIDFGFMLANSPGGLNIESMPFKLPQEAIDIMGGIHSDLFQYFRVLVYSAFREAAKHADQIIFLVEMMLQGPHFPCFGTDPKLTLELLKSRFHTSGDLSVWVKEAIDQSCDNWYVPFF